MTRTLASLSLVLTALFVLAILALHVLSAEVNPVVSGISYYALSRYGCLLGLALASIGIGGSLLAFALWQATHSVTGRIGLALLILWGLTSIMAALFPLDAPGAAPTLSGRIHGASGMNFLLIVPALLFIELARSKSASSALPRPPSFWLSWALLAAAILLFVFNGPLYSLQIGGAIQRLYWLILVLWLAFKAASTRRGLPPDGQQSGGLTTR